MTWAHPYDVSRGVPLYGVRPRELPLASHAQHPAPAGLGRVSAGRAWAWSEAPRRTQPATELHVTLPAAPAEPVLVRVPPSVLREMAKAAQVAGRSEGELWAEAAREWLTRRARGDEPLPPTPAAPALPVPRPLRSWSAIDSVLRDLRQPYQPRRLPATPETPVRAPAA